jgi:hypothetical protein
MRIPEVRDYGNDEAEVWLRRLRRITRVAQLVLDLSHSLFPVAFLMLIGAVAGALIGGRWGEIPFWCGMAFGGVLGMALGIYWARRIFFTEQRKTIPAEQAHFILSAGAYRWPGVEERFSRMRNRGLVLALLMGAALIAMAYLNAAAEHGLPVPFSMPAVNLDLILLGFILALLPLLALNSRCPKCRRFLWKALQLRQCPHCGVVLRALEP